MNIPVNIFMWLLACLPIIVLLVLMIKFQWGATDAAPIGLAITIFTGIVFYKADLKVIVSEASKGIWNALTILVIVWTAVLLYQVGNETRAFLVIRDGMRRLLPNELLLVLAMGWIFESFLQGITGFGVPVAVGAPLLIGIGVKPMWAVIIPLLGQSWGNTFGTLAAAWDALVMSAGISSGSKEYLITAFWTALFIWFWNLIIGITICWFYGKGKAIRKGFLPVLLLSLVQGGGELLLTQVNTTIACCYPAAWKTSGLQTGMECSGQPGDGQREVCREGGSKAGGNDPHTCVCAIFSSLRDRADRASGGAGTYIAWQSADRIFFSGDGHGVWICQ